MSEDLSLRIQGMTCASCVARVERALKKVPGVVDASVNLATENAHVIADPTLVNANTLIGAIKGTGYEPEVAQATFAIGDLEKVPIREEFQAKCGRQ